MKPNWELEPAHEGTEEQVGSKCLIRSPARRVDCVASFRWNVFIYWYFFCAWGTILWLVTFSATWEQWEAKNVWERLMGVLGRSWGQTYILEISTA